jgi:hypothetical protein
MPGVVMVSGGISGCGLTPNTYLAIWKATVYYMIFNMASDILDPVKPNYCPLFKNLLQIQIKIFKLFEK